MAWMRNLRQDGSRKSRRFHEPRCCGTGGVSGGAELSLMNVGQNAARERYKARRLSRQNRQRVHSHVEVLNPRLFAFSDTARLIWSEAPFGKLALISKVILSSARGSATRLLIISSASWTRRIFAVAGLTSTEP